MALSFALSFAVLLAAVLPVQSSYCASTCAVHVTQPILFLVANNAPNRIPVLSRKTMMVDPHRSKLVYLYLSAILVSNACDVATNPGPPKFPCNICKKAVRWTTPGVCCDTCDQWFHKVSCWVHFVSSGCGKTWAETRGESFVFTCKGCTEVKGLEKEVEGLKKMVEEMMEKVTGLRVEDK